MPGWVRDAWGYRAMVLSLAASAAPRENRRGAAEYPRRLTAAVTLNKDKATNGRFLVPFTPEPPFRLSASPYRLRNVWFPHIVSRRRTGIKPPFVDIQTDPPPLALAACQRRLSVGLSTAATVVHEPMTVDGAYPETVVPNHPPKTARNPSA